jgi:hypothetical protein
MDDGERIDHSGIDTGGGWSEEETEEYHGRLV